MTKEQIINSGNLEAYLLGTLTEEEQRFIEEYIEIFPDLRDELDHIEESLFQMAEMTRVEPKKEIKTVLFNKMHKTAPISQVNEESSVAPKRLILMQAASIAFFLISLSAIYILYEKERVLQDMYTQLQNDHIQLLDQNQYLRESLHLQKTQISRVSHPAYIKIPLISTSSDVSLGQGTAYWNAEKGNIFIIVSETPMVTTEEDLQLWAIISGQPVSVGVVNSADASLHQMNSVTGAEAFALSIEPKGGSKVPTVDKIILSGVVSL